MSKAGRKANIIKDAANKIKREQAAVLYKPDSGKVAKNAAEQARAMGVQIVCPVQDRRSGNRFLGSENPKSKINPNGYDPVARAKDLANQQVRAKLTKAVLDHG